MNGMIAKTRVTGMTGMTRMTGLTGMTRMTNTKRGYNLCSCNCNPRNNANQV